jgi:predicted Zn-dependent peptidase
MSGGPTWTTLPLAGALPLSVQRRPGPAIVAARLLVAGGSGADPAGHRGAHQLLAGLMTRGCADLDAEALADLVEGAGASLRAEAHEDALTVALKCAVEDAGDLLPLLPAMVCRPRLDPDQLALERQLNLQGLQRQREDPFHLAHDQLRRQLYGDGPYGHDPLGIDAELAETDRDDLLPLVAGLGRGSAVFSLCGDLSPQQAAALLEPAIREFWPRGGGDANPPPGHVALPGGPLGRLALDTEQVVILLGSATVPLGHPDALPLRILQSHLGYGMSSRLFVQMREERGLAYDVGVHFPARRASAPFVFHLSTSADRAEEASRCLLDEWQRLAERPLTPAERQLAVAKLVGQDAMGRQTVSQIADRQALLLSHGLPADHVDRELERARRLTSADLAGAARRHLSQPRISLVGPAEALGAAERAWSRHHLSRLAGAA